MNLVTSLFFDGCIERGRGITQGGAKYCIAQLDLIGIVNVIDSLTAVKQFVYDAGTVPMRELVAAVQNNWEGYEALQTVIAKKTEYFGNDAEVSNDMARRLTCSLYEYLKDKTNVFGYRFPVGNLIGYHTHHKWFGDLTKATPDGRHDGEALFAV